MITAVQTPEPITASRTRIYFEFLRSDFVPTLKNDIGGDLLLTIDDVSEITAGDIVQVLYDTVLVGNVEVLAVDAINSTIRLDTPYTPVTNADQYIVNLVEQRPNYHGLLNVNGFDFRVPFYSGVGRIDLRQIVTALAAKTDQSTYAGFEHVEQTGLSGTYAVTIQEVWRGALGDVTDLGTFEYIYAWFDRGQSTDFAAYNIEDDVTKSFLNFAGGKIYVSGGNIMLPFSLSFVNPDVSVALVVEQFNESGTLLQTNTYEDDLFEYTLGSVSIPANIVLPATAYMEFYLVDSGFVGTFDTTETTFDNTEITMDFFI
jgi:hypothetical protein